MRQRRMLYIRKFYVVNLYCIFISTYISVYIKISCIYACLFVCKKSVCIWRHYKYIRLCICTDNGTAKNVVY